MDQHILDIANLSKTYGNRKALKNVSLQVKKGEMVALIGPSGSGKSTLLRNATALILGDDGSGTVSVLGHDVQKNGKLADDVRTARATVGFVFQQFNLVGRLSLFQNVMLGALGRLPFWRGLFGFWPHEDKDKAMAALARVGVAEYAGQRANTLSGGQQQRGSIARALVQGAKAIFLDEPVASLDPVSAHKVMALLAELNGKDGVSVVVVLHQIDHAIKFCSRIVALKSGEIVFDGPAKDLTKDRLIEIYGAEYDPELGDTAPKEEAPTVATGPQKGEISKPLGNALQALAASVLIFLGGFFIWQQNKPVATTGTEVKFSILATENSQSLGARWAPFLADMEAQTGLKIVPYFGTGYAPLVTAMNYGQTQIGWFSNKPGLEVVSTGKAEVFMRSSDPSGVDGYVSNIIVPVDSHLTIEQIMACDHTLDFGMGDPSSTSGTLAPLAYLFAPRGVMPQDCFKTVRSASHEANVQAVANHLMAAATNNSTSLQVMGAQDPGLIARVRVIWESPRLPEDPIIWRTDLDPDVKQKLRHFFVSYGRQGDEAQQTRERAILASLSFGLFQPASNDHLIPVRQLEATEDLIEAEQAGDPSKINAAQAHLVALRREAEAAAARAPQPLPSTPTEGYAPEGVAHK